MSSQTLGDAESDETFTRLGVAAAWRVELHAIGEGLGNSEKLPHAATIENNRVCKFS